METCCMRCGRLFESDSWNVDVCPVCDSELAGLENDERLMLRSTDDDAFMDDIPDL